MARKQYPASQKNVNHIHASKEAALSNRNNMSQSAGIFISCGMM